MGWTFSPPGRLSSTQSVLGLLPFPEYFNSGGIGVGAREAIFTYLANFQRLFWPLVMIKDDHLRILPIGLLSFQNEYGQQIELLMASTVMYILPLMILFIVMQKQMVARIQLGGVKE